MAAKHSVHQTMINARKKQVVEGMATVWLRQGHAVGRKRVRRLMACVVFARW
ncbi:hypothetical protein [Xanthobacter agilis]|uniref:Trehalose utilization protein n=1 Tax=Xanthobacter agilis TaxID=47492 RepID=A0ABU0LFF4_XANAG|nr:trehalose utilization protein [Xanthobacter agilis]